MRKRWSLALILAVAITMLISACGGTDTGGNASSTPTAGSTLGKTGLTCVQGTLAVDGSSALQPLVDAVAKDYQAKCSGANITVQPGGSKKGLADVESGAVVIGNSDVFADAATQADLVDHQVAVVTFAVIINGKVGVKNLTTDQIKNIYAGKVTNWQDLGGPNKAITVVSRPTTSGTRATFQQLILGGPETISGPASLTTDSTTTVIQNVAQNEGAIGYAAAFPASQNTDVALVSLDGNAPTADLTKNNTYKFWNIEHMYTKGKPSDIAQALLDYMASAQGKTILGQ